MSKSNEICVYEDEPGRAHCIIVSDTHAQTVRTRALIRKDRWVEAACSDEREMGGGTLLDGNE